MASENHTALPRVLQEFGVRFHHQTTPTFQWRLREVLYNDIVTQLSYDPFFPHSSPDFTKPLRKQQGSSEGTEYSEAARGRPCGHVFGKGETVFRCRNCGMDDTCVLCQKCYRASNHEGHDVAMSINSGNGGCCDCGDPEAWRAEMRCQYHYSEKPIEPTLQPEVPKEIERRIRETVSHILDFVLDVMSHAQDSSKPPRLDDDTDPRKDAARSRLRGSCYDETLEQSLEESWSTVLWNDEKHNFEEVIDIVKRACSKPKAYGRQVAQNVDGRGRATVYTGNLEEAVRIATFLSRIRLGVTVRSSRDIFREDMVEVLVNFLQDLANLNITVTDGQQNTELVRQVICEEMCNPWQPGIGVLLSQQRSSLPTAPMTDSDDAEDEPDVDDPDAQPEEGETTDIEMIDAQNGLPADTNGDTQAAEEVTFRMGPVLTGLPEQDALIMARAEGDPDVFIAPQPPLPLPPARGDAVRLNDLDAMGRTQLDALLELAGQGNVFEIAVTEGTAGIDEAEQIVSPGIPGIMLPDRTLPSLSIDANRRQICPDHWTEDYLGAEAMGRTRLTALFLQDLRLWKLARAGLRELYITTMVAIPGFKREMGIRFAVAYKELTEAFLFADREPDQSMILFSVQIFTVPSIAEVLVRDYKFITTLLAVCYTYYSQHKIGYPHEVDTNAKQLTDVYAFRSKRHYHIVNDLRYLLCTGAVQKLIPSMQYVQAQFIDWLELFQGQNPQQKALRYHVEYESDAWVSAFNVTMQIAKHTQMFARTFDNATREQLQSALSLCLHRLRAWSNSEDAGCRPAFEPRAPFEDNISFHHPLHWFFVGLTSHANSDGDLSIFQQLSQSDELFNIVKYPLRVLHMIWEIRCNLWVRNGHSIRLQLYHYTDVDSREHCVDKDIQFVQLALASFGSSHRFSREAQEWTDEKGDTTKYLESFNRHDSIMRAMMSLFVSVPRADAMDQETNLIHMQDHLFHFFITLFSERSWLLKTSIEDNIARALRHGLIFGPKTYSEICKMVNDDRGDEACFDKVVEQMTIFTPPTGLEDVGRFSLKDAEFDLVDPYYFHYSLQQIEEATEILSKRGPSADLVTEKSLANLDMTPWSGLVEFALCDTIQNYIVDYFASLKKAAAVNLEVATIRETVTDKILQFLLLVCQEEANRRARGAQTLNWGVFPLKCADLFLQNDVLQDPCLRPHRAKITSLLHRLRHLNGESPDSHAISPRSPNKREHMDDGFNTSLDEYARKKALAKARQAQLMQDMKASQDAFLLRNEATNTTASDTAVCDFENDSSDATWLFPAGNCIICQNAVGNDGSHGVLACVQESRLDRPAPLMSHFTSGLRDLLDRPLSMDEHRDWSPQGIENFPTGQAQSRDSITSCGHVMHWDCYSEFYDTIKDAHYSLVNQGRNLPSQVEFQCPLCKTVGNTMLPVLSSRQQLQPVSYLHEGPSYETLFSEAQWSHDWTFNYHEAALASTKFIEDHDCRERIEVLENTSRFNDLDTQFEEPLDFMERTNCFGDLDEALEKQTADYRLHNYSDTRPLARPAPTSKINFIARTSVLTSSIVDVEIALRDRTHNDNNKSPVATLVEGMSDQNLVSLRTQANMIRCAFGLGCWWQVAYGGSDDMVLDPYLGRFESYIAFRRSRFFPDLADSQNVHEVMDHWSENNEGSPLFLEDNFFIFVQLSLIYEHANKTLQMANLLLEVEIVKTALAFCSAFERYTRKELPNAGSIPMLSENHCQQIRVWLSQIMPADLYYPNTDQHISVLYRVLQQFSLAFIRKFAIFATSVLGIEPPVVVGSSYSNELDKLTDLYGLSSLDQVTQFTHAIEGGRRQQAQKYWVLQMRSARHEIRHLSWPLPVTLAKLPKSLDTLFERCLGFICPRCKTTPPQPALCLLCGTLLCFQSQCCWNDTLGVGECTAHKEHCGGSLGLYLIIKRSALVVMRRDGGAFGPAPYLDMHGELDPDLRRGKPQFLSERRYEAGVRQLYLQHQIPTWLARKLENHVDMGGWETL